MWNARRRGWRPWRRRRSPRRRPSGRPRRTEGLRLLDGLGEPGAGGVHLVEHVVGGAVDDAEDLAHVVARQRLADRAQDRDRAGDGGLVVEVDPEPVGRGIQVGAVLGEQRLVGALQAPCSIALRIRLRAGSMPPMTSMTMSAFSTSESASVVNRVGSTGRPERSRPARRTAMPTARAGGRPGGEVSAARSACGPPTTRPRRTRGGPP